VFPGSERHLFDFAIWWQLLRWHYSNSVSSFQAMQMALCEKDAYVLHSESSEIMLNLIFFKVIFELTRSFFKIIAQTMHLRSVLHTGWQDVFVKKSPDQFFVKFNAYSLLNGVYWVFYANTKWHWTYSLSIKHWKLGKSCWTFYEKYVKKGFLDQNCILNKVSFGQFLQT
jgi:hypothetical protein